MNLSVSPINIHTHVGRKADLLADEAEQLTGADIHDRVNATLAAGYLDLWDIYREKAGTAKNPAEAWDYQAKAQRAFTQMEHYASLCFRKVAGMSEPGQLRAAE